MRCLFSEDIQQFLQEISRRLLKIVTFGAGDFRSSTTKSSFRISSNIIAPTYFDVWIWACCDIGQTQRVRFFGRPNDHKDTVWAI